MKKPNLAAYSAASVSLVAQSFLLSSCAGGGGTHTVTAQEASNAVAAAKNPAQMHTAFQKVLQVSGFVRPATGSKVVGQISADTQANYEHYQLVAPATAYLTLAQAYTTVNDDPHLAGYKLSLSAADVANSINSNLAFAYAHPSGENAATLILLSAEPGQIPRTPPTMSANSPLSPVQQLMLAKYLGELYGGHGTVILGPGDAEAACIDGCIAAFAAEVAEIAEEVAECEEGTFGLGTEGCLALGAAELALDSIELASCISDCHNQ